MDDRNNEKVYEPADLLSRLVAHIIDDIIIAIGSMLIIPGLLYFLLKDDMNDGRSIGKGLMGLRVVNYKTGNECNFTESALRNLVWWIPVINLVEFLVVILDAEGRRMGDDLAGTIVVNDEQ